MLDEAAVDGAIDVLAEDAFAFLERLVAAPCTVGHETAAGDVLADELRLAGFAVERPPVPPAIADDPLAGVAQLDYAGRTNVVGTRGRGTGRSLLLNGHLGVVPAAPPQWGASPPLQPRPRAGGTKGGSGTGPRAVRGPARGARGFEAGRLTLPGVGEEACPGNGRLAAVRSGSLADAVVVLEPTDLRLLTGGVGVLWLDVV